jgi:hypothetical protein
MIGGTHTDWWEGFMKYAAEMSSGAMIYTPGFIKIQPFRSYWGRGGGGIHSMDIANV